MACDEDDFDDDFDYDDTDYFDYWAGDCNADNADDYWAAFDSFVCVGTSPNDDDDDDDSWWGDDDYDNDDDEDPCDNGACDDDDNNDDTNNNDAEHDCAGVRDGEAYIDRCGNCVGGTTGASACEDCSGVENGLSQYIICGDDSVCVNRNAGKFDYQLDYEDQQEFEQILLELESNCWTNTLLNNIDSHSGLKISIDNHPQYPGRYEPCNHGISFDAQQPMTTYSLTAELFHAYQEQIWGGKLRDIKMDYEHNHIGGSNIEAEEKVMGYIANSWNAIGGAIVEEGYNYNKLNEWAENYLINHISIHSCGLLENELVHWYEAVEEFAFINSQINMDMPRNTTYGSPVDYTLQPIGIVSICRGLSEECLPISDIIVTPNSIKKRAHK